MMKTLDDYGIEQLDAISKALYPNETDSWDQGGVEESLYKTAQAMISTADYSQALDMVQFVMIQSLVDMAYNKGTNVVDRIYQVVKQIERAEHENDGTEFSEERMNRLMWRKRQLEGQRWYWQRAWKAWNKAYLKIVMVLKTEGTYENLPDYWQPPHIRYGKMNQEAQARLVRSKQSATAAAARAEARS